MKSILDLDNLCGPKETMSTRNGMESEYGASARNRYDNIDDRFNPYDYLLKTAEDDELDEAQATPSILDTPVYAPTTEELPIPLSTQDPDFDGPDFRNLGDVDAERQQIFDRIEEAARNFAPVQNKRHTLILQDVHYTGEATPTKAQHKQALLSNDYLTRKLNGTWVLKDNTTGDIVAHKRGVIAHVPYLTPLGTFARGGNDYALSHQFRLRPGVYTRWQNNGELEAHINVKSGLGHKIYMDPESGIFKMKFGQSSLPAINVLKILGVSDKTLSEAWGPDLYAANSMIDDPKAINKLYERVTYGKGAAASREEKCEAIKEAFQRMTIDPIVTKTTLGQPYSHVTPEVILATTNKLVRINRGEENTDSRDNMAFQKLYGPEDLMADRLAASANTVRTAFWKTSAHNNLDKMPSGIFDKAIDGAIIGSGLGMPLEEINPIEVFDNQFRVSRLGEGGISSIDAIPDSARNVHPSQLGFTDVIRTPESLKAGVDARLVYNLKKGRDGQIYTQVRDRQGDLHWKSATDVASSIVAFPNEMDSKKKFVACIVNGHVRMLPRDKVEYELPRMQNANHAVGNMVPALSSVKAQRGIMAARMITQALPLENREAPLVQSGRPDAEDESFEEYFGDRFGAIKAKEPMVITRVTPNEVQARTKDGKTQTFELYNNLMFNRKTGLNQEAIVKPGDVVNPGQTFVRSNFTDDKGTTAIGINAKVCYLPYKGLNFEDGFVVSESFAKKMASTHYYKNRLPIDASTTVGTKNFAACKPGVYTRQQLESFDDNGIIKPGTVVKAGDPLILAVNKVEPTEAQLKAGRKFTWKDASVTWDHHDDGVVTDVFCDSKGAQVIVKSRQELHEADKLSGRYGNKGVVARIIPDEELPTLEDGSKPDLLWSSLALVSRVNSAQIAETLLGKIAAKTGKRYAITDFKNDSDLMAFVDEEMKKHGIKDTEDLQDNSDPDHPKVIPQVLCGRSYIMKLHHSAESKAQGRGVGRYTTDGQPAKGGDDGAKKAGMLELTALLSHGATNNLVDLKYVKGQENLDYWRQYIAGYNPPTPKIPYVYNKFVNYLKGSGINVVRDGAKLNLMALTNKDVEQMTQGKELTGVVDKRTGLKTLPTVAWQDGLKALPNGLFDPAVTGGHSGNSWSYIKMDTKLVNPIMEVPLRQMLGLTETTFRNVLAGKESIATGTGPEALYAAASKLDIDNEITRAEDDIKSGKKTFRDSAVKRIGYLRSAKKLGQHPKDWFLDKAPVLPPFFRPVSVMGGNGLPLVSDPNYLYKNLFDTNQAYMSNKEMFGKETTGDLCLSLYDSLKAVTGLGDPTTKELKQKEVGGLLKHVFGSGAKYSMIQTKLLGTPVDMSGRGVISVNPDYDMDTIGLPENIAWDSYKPLILRKLRQSGRNGVSALHEVENKSVAARKCLQEVMESRPVLLNRAPTLHKFGIMALMPKLIKGDTIKINPFICRGAGADFDGNCCDFNTVLTLRSSEPHGVSALEQGAQLIGEEGTTRFYRMKIGEFPHTEDYTTDKNGARVYTVPEGIEVLTYNVKTGEAEFQPVNGLTIEDDCQVTEVTIAGRHVIVSNNESLVTFDYKNGSLKKATPEDAKHSLVPVFKQDPTPFGSFGTRELGWWIGAALSKGIIQDNTLTYSEKNVAVRNKWVQGAQMLADRTDATFDRNTLSITDNLLMSLGHTQVSIANRVEPSSIVDTLNSPGIIAGSKEFLFGIFSGVLDSLGHIHRHNTSSSQTLFIRISPLTQELHTFISYLAYRLGIRLRRQTCHNVSGDSFSIRIDTASLYHCLQELTLHNPRILRMLQGPCMMERNQDTTDRIPVSLNEYKALLPHVSRDTYPGLFNFLTRPGKHGRAIPRHLLLEASGLYPFYTDSLMSRIYSSNVLWCPVSSSVPVENRQVFDLIVPVTKVFCANQGIIIQDTMVFHVPTTQEAVDEALEKMLPSKNLLSPGDFTAVPIITKEHEIGLYEGTRKHDKPVTRTFATRKDVVEAWKRGEINPDENVRVLEK